MIETQESILNDFFDDEEFAEVVTINGNEVVAIFDNENIIDETGSVPVYRRTAMLTVRDSDIYNVKQNDIVVVRDKVYKVKTIEPDGTGVSSVYLIIKQ